MVQINDISEMMGELADKKDADGLDADGVAKQTDIFSEQAEGTATTNFDITDLFPKQSGITTASGNGRIGRHSGKPFWESILIHS